MVNGNTADPSRWAELLGKLPPAAAAETNEPADPSRVSSGGERAGLNTRPTGKPPKANRARVAADRFGQLNAFLDSTAGTLERSELLVWLSLFRDVRDDVARTGQAAIARRIGLSERTVRWAVSRLEKRGLLTAVRRGSLSTGPTSYRLHPIATPPG